MIRSHNLNHKVQSSWTFQVHLRLPKFVYCFKKFECITQHPISVANFD
jgi:hypothetical protein